MYMYELLLAAVDMAIEQYCIHVVGQSVTYLSTVKTTSVMYRVTIKYNYTLHFCRGINSIIVVILQG